MRKRSLLIFGSVLLAISVILVVWQGSFNLGKFGPSNPFQTFIFWAISIPAVIALREAVRILGTSPSDQQPRDVLIVGSGPADRSGDPTCLSTRSDSIICRAVSWSRISLNPSPPG